MHVPIPFSTSGSSIATVVRALTVVHGQAGGRTSVVVSHNRDLRVEGAANLLVDYTRRCPQEWFRRSQVLRDHAFGRVGLTRPCYGRLMDDATALAQDYEPDIVLVHEGHYASATLPRWRRALRDRARLVLYVHTPLSKAYGRRELGRLLRCPDDIAFVSRALAEATADRVGGTLPARFGVVHNGVDHVVFHPRGRRAPSDRDGMTVAYAGEVAPHKGVHVLLEAVASLDERVNLVVVGSSRHASGTVLSDYERQLRAAAARTERDIVFRPYMPQADVAEVFRQADVVCIPSVWSEPFGMVAAEAMSCGAAVVASDIGGLPEACGEAGILVPPGDPTALREALAALRDPVALAQAQRRSVAVSGERSWVAAHGRLKAMLL